MAKKGLYAPTGGWDILIPGKLLEKIKNLESKPKATSRDK